MYSIDAYGQMIADQTRMDACVAAFRDVVTPGSVVVDIGTGPGVFALLACQLGARKVYAIETAHVIEVAERMAKAAGYSDRIEFIQRPSTQVELPEAADLVFSDTRGVLPLFRTHIPTVIDARERFLKEGGRLIPYRDVIRLAVVETPELYDQYVRVWGEDVYGLNMIPGREYALNVWYRGQVEREQMLSEAVDLFQIDYTTIDSPHMKQAVSFAAQRAGVAHGMMLWFDAMLTDSVGFSNAPGEREMVYGRAFFPWRDPVELEPGDAIQVEIIARLVGDEYVWNWATEVRGAGGGALKAQFKQSTFLSDPLSLQALKRTQTDHIPQLTIEGHIVQDILQASDGSQTVAMIAQTLHARYPQRFQDLDSAISKVGQVTQAYSE